MDWWGPGRAVFFDPRGGTHFEGGWQWPGGKGDSWRLRIRGPQWRNRPKCEGMTSE